MMTRFMWIKRKPVAAVVVICLVLAGGFAALLQMGHVAEAAVLDPHPGLVGWWRFDEGTGNLAKDNSGYGNDGTVYGATWVVGKYGQALSFDGTNDYVLVKHNAMLNAQGNFTIEAWIKTSLSSVGTIVSKYAGGVGWHLAVTLEGKVLSWFYASASDYTTNMVSTKTVNDGAWHYIVIARTYGDKYRVYIDGDLDKSYNDNTVGEVSNTENVYLGTRPGLLQYFNGVIDEVRIYNRALSAAEIQENFQKGPEFSSRLLAKVPKGATQVMTTLSWQGVGSINVTMVSPSKNYTEDMVRVYQKTVYSSSSGDMLNIKRLALSVTALSSDENWYIILEFDDVEDYRITVEVQI
jgi:hypothetical protein